MAHKKAGGSKAGQGSKPKGKRLGIKMYAGELINPGQIIVRQKGTKFHPNLGVGMGRDHTIFAKIAGKVKMHVSRGKKLISVESSEK